MATTEHLAPTSAPVEGDGINYRGIRWFALIMVITVLFCQGTALVVFHEMNSYAIATEAPRSALMAPVGQLPPAPNLLTDEAGNLRKFRAEEDKTLTTYAWIDQSAGIVRIPIDRAKALLLEKGLPVRGQEAAGAKAAASK